MEEISPLLKTLREKSAALPRRPGVYLMKNAKGRIIYVGKSRSLRDRVSSYFHLPPDAHPKTLRMVSNVADFDFMLCDTEIEALTLENSLIKQHTPKYNIKLKDAKSYPYIKVTVDESYPRIGMTRKRAADKAKYFGPYMSTQTVYDTIKLLERTLKIPTCKRVFPRDIGKERPCIYRQLGRCIAPCAGDVSPEDYGRVVKNALSLLSGKTRETIASLEAEMYACADDERFEEAARCRDSIEALKKLNERQKVVGSPDSEFDAAAIYSDELGSAASVFFIRSGAVADSASFVFGADEIVDVGGNGYADAEYNYTSDENDGSDETVTVTSFLTELYAHREYIPSEILLSFKLPDSERELLEAYLREKSGHKVTLRTPERGENKKLCDMVRDNAAQFAAEHRRKSEGDERILVRLAHLLSLETVPERIEAYDISNLGSEHITAGMVVAKNGRLSKADYRVFNIKSQDGQDDYAAMREAISRRIAHLDDEKGSYSERPDLILLDGGAAHVSVITQLLDELRVDIPVFGMVKDEHHKTRSIIASDGGEISIARENEVFVFIYKLQEEVHRFTVSKMTGAKRKTVRTSSLEKIKGIGPSKARLLLNEFGSIAAISQATESQLASASGISKADARVIFDYFAQKQRGDVSDADE